MRLHNPAANGQPHAEPSDLKASNMRPGSYAGNPTPLSATFGFAGVRL